MIIYLFSLGRHAKLVLLLCIFVSCSSTSWSTANHEYGDDEYVTIVNGISPNKKYAITTHGEGGFGYGNFHLFLMNVVTGGIVEPLREIVEFLDTDACAYSAIWSKDSRRLAIVYRTDRHEPLKSVYYRIDKGWAALVKGPVDATEKQITLWGKHATSARHSGKIFGTPKKHEPETGPRKIVSADNIIWIVPLEDGNYNEREGFSYYGSSVFASGHNGILTVDARPYGVLRVGDSVDLTTKGVVLVNGQMRQAH